LCKAILHNGIPIPCGNVAIVGSIAGHPYVARLAPRRSPRIFHQPIIYTTSRTIADNSHGMIYVICSSTA